nr:mediator of RNA polymerase II transcription subunit 22 isoform X2 [Vicugna pacos]
MRSPRSRELAPARDFGFKAAGLLSPAPRSGAVPRARRRGRSCRQSARRGTREPGLSGRGARSSPPRPGVRRAPALRTRCPLPCPRPGHGPAESPAAEQGDAAAVLQQAAQGRRQVHHGQLHRNHQDRQGGRGRQSPAPSETKGSGRVWRLWTVIEDETQVSRATQGEQDNYEMHVRAANIVRAGESLMKLVSDLKQFLILNDFPSVNEAIDQRNQQLRALQEECDRKLVALRDEVSIDLYELEEEYYSSSSSLCEANDLPLCEAYWRLDLDTDPADGLSAPLLASPEPSAGPLQAAAPAHSHTGGPVPTEHT